MSLFLFACTAIVSAQETPLSLTQILTALQSTSSGLSMSQKDSFVTQRVNQRGVTFTVTAELTAELKNAGASNTLVASIKNNGPQSNQTSTTKSASVKQDIKFDKLWVEQDVVRDGRKGLVVHTAFTAYNLNDTSLQLTVRFQDGTGSTLKSANENFANKNGELALFKNLKPGFDAAEYKDWSVFVPYDEMQVSPGRQQLKINADVNYPDGKLLKHLTLNEITITKPGPNANQPRAAFEKMWVDYGVSENNKLGMRIHTKLKTYNLMNTTCWLKVMFEKDNGDRLVAANTLYADRTGGATVYLELTPGSSVSIYNDISVFMPYEELNLGTGEYSLKMHADLTYSDEGLIQHLTYYPFNYTQR